MIAACTIVSPNYLPFARVLCRSYLRRHPGHRFFVLIVADTDDPAPFAGEPFEPVMLSSLRLPDFREIAMMYDILELNTDVKPAFLRYLLDSCGAEQVVYLDPDIAVYSPLIPIFAALDAGASAVLTPHITEPIDNDERSPSEQDLLYNGTYNLGFFAARRCAETTRLLAWWSERCLTQGVSEGRTGLFVDQKWMNLVPGMFADVAIVRDVGCNMAYWNLQERRLAVGAGAEDIDRGAHTTDVRVPRRRESAWAGERDAVTAVEDPPVRQEAVEESADVAAGAEAYVVNGSAPLRFFHFSGIDPSDATQLSRSTDRFTLTDRPDLAPLFTAYRAALASDSGMPAEQIPYGFDRMSDGTAVTRLARRIYSRHRARWKGEDPFQASGGFAQFAKRLGLIAGKAAVAKSTWREFDPRDRRVLLVHRLLRAALRTLGPNRYELLMRYLGYITVLRNQAVFLDETER